MKKILFTAFMSIGMLYTVFAQGVYNGDFEAWENKVFFEDPIGYTSANAQLFMMGATPNLTKSTDAVEGTYSVRMETTVFDGDTVFGYAVFGQPNDNFLFGGFPFTDMPDSIKGSFKYNTANGDSAVILVLFKKNGFPIGMQFIPFAGVQNTWSEMAFKINPLGIAPDSAIIGFASSLPEADQVNPGNWLMVDDISFTNATTSIPNNGFENWKTVQSEEPLGWNTFNLYFLLEGQLPSVTRSTDAYMGNSAISVKTKALSLFGGELDTFGIATTGMIGDFGFSGGFAMSKKPDSLSFYYKYNNSNNPSDLAIVYASFSKFDAGLQQSITVDSSMTFLPGAFNWTRKTFVFNSTSAIPDTSNILLMSSNLFFGSTMGYNNELIVDEMIYYYGAVGIPVIADDFQTSYLYPSPATSQINMDFNLFADQPNGLFVTIHDLNGKIVYQKQTSTKQIGKQTISTDIDFLAAGTYIFSISDGGENAFTAKFIKE